MQPTDDLGLSDAFILTYEVRVDFVVSDITYYTEYSAHRLEEKASKQERALCKSMRVRASQRIRPSKSDQAYGSVGETELMPVAALWIK
ncbi:Protein of unknown function [Gryllus bimaculatus]|nr:Protein of unknown function [Gryllus bimaculatus]